MSLRSIIIKIYKKKPNPLLHHSARLYGPVRRATRKLFTRKLEGITFSLHRGLKNVFLYNLTQLFYLIYFT